MARTIQTAVLFERERQALALLVQAQWQVLMVRGEIIANQAAEDDERDSYARGIEALNDHVCERIHKICAKHAIGTEGTQLEMLDRLSDYILRLEDVNTESGKPYSKNEGNNWQP